MSLAATGSISMTIGIPLVLGTNIGTTITAVVSSISANKNAKKAAMIHLIYNIVSVVLFIPFTNHFAVFIEYLGGETPQQIANIHTFFNLISALILLPFSKYLMKLTDILIKSDDTETVSRLDKRFLEKPAIAFEQAFQETLHMYELARQNLKIASTALIGQKSLNLKEIDENEKILNKLERDISSFLVSITTRYKHEVDNTRIASMIKIISDIERIGDHAQNIGELAIEVANSETKFSEDAVLELKQICKTTLTAVDTAYDGYRDNNYLKAADTFEIEERIDYLEEHLRDNHIIRLNNSICQAHSGAIFLDVISNLERIGDHSVNIAESILKTQKSI
jgi:phosphate:Na+ symporter